jgi:cytochrome c553
MVPWKKLEGPLIGATLGVMAFLVINVALGREILPGPRRTYETFSTPVIDMDPASLYATNCAACHQADGRGLAGQFPPLAGSEWVIEDPETPVRVMLRGIQGEVVVAGQTYNGVMPPQAHLNDEQIAILATHIRSQWGNDASEVTPETVAAVRAESQGMGPCDGTAELARLRAP